MAYEERNSSASATTAIVAIVVLVILAVALYYGFFAQGGPEVVPENTTNVELNQPNNAGDTGEGEMIETTI